MLAREPIETRTEDGWVLRGELVHPEGEPVAAAAVGHAMMADRRTMDRRGQGLCTTLAEQGIAVLNFDVRGHGESGPGARDGGRWTYDSFVRWDVPAIVAEARRRFADRKVTVVGHSLVGHAALISSGLRPDRAPDGVVAIAANLWLPSLEPSLRRRVLKGAALAVWTAASLPRGYFDPSRFRMGNVPEPLPYVWQFTRDFFRGRLTSPDGRDDYVAALGRAEIPVLSITSTGDRLFAHPDAVARFLAPMRRARLTEHVIDARELSPPPGHMELVVSERCRPIWIEIAQWIRALAREDG